MKLRPNKDLSALYKYLPSMKMGLVALASLCAVLLYAYTNREETVVVQQNQKKAASGVDISRMDTDKDGVADWKEKLFGFNPLLSDSDGDGTPDSTEIAEAEQTLQIKQEKGAIETKQAAQLTETAKLAQDGMKAVIALNQQGALSDESIGALTETATDSIQNKEYTSTYTTKDIKIVRSNEESLSEYANKVAYIFLKEEAIFLQDGPALLKTYTMTRSPKDLQKVTAMRQNVTNMGITLLSFQTPDQLSPAAVRAIQEFDKYGMILDDLKKIDSDPVASLSAMSQFYKTRYTLTNSVVEIIREAQKLGVTFTAGDPGGILLEAATK